MMHTIITLLGKI